MLDRQEQQTSIKPFSFMRPCVKATTLFKIISVVSTRFSPFTVSHLESDLLTTMPLSSRTWLPFHHLYGHVLRQLFSLTQHMLTDRPFTIVYGARLSSIHFRRPFASLMYRISSFPSTTLVWTFISSHLDD